jgi:transposase
MMHFSDKPVYLCLGATDMRKQITGLAEQVRLSFDLDPFDEAMFVFCNKSRDRIKILEWDTDGFWLYFKRLEKGRFRWPNVTDDENKMELTSEELGLMISSAKLEKKLKRSEVSERKIA